MNKLVKRAEVAKMAAVLSLPREDLRYLESFDPAALQELREQVTDMLDEADRQKMAKAARLVAKLPPRVTARIAKRFVPPRLAARVGELITERKALKLTSRFPASYIADIARSTNPRRMSNVLGELPVEVIRDVAKHLSARRDFGTMSLVVPYVDPRALEPVLGALPDEALIHTVYLLEDDHALDRLVALIPDARFGALLQVVREQELWVEIVSLLAMLRREQHARLVDALMHQDDDFRSVFIGAIHDNNAWDTMLAMFRVLPPDGQVYFGSLVSRRPAEVLEQYIYAAVKGSLWGDLSGLILVMPEEASRMMVAMCERIGEETGSLGLQELARQMSEVTSDSPPQDADSTAP